jgi:nucleotide-binding universal stress UspA family protein
MIKRILVGTDTSASADLAVEHAADLARAHDAELTVLYVRPATDGREVFDPNRLPDPDGYLARMGGRFPRLRVHTLVRAGDPAKQICDVAQSEGSDVIVVGNRGVHGRRRFFAGSVPTEVVHRSPCSVFVVDTRVAQ